MKGVVVSIVLATSLGACSGADQASTNSAPQAPKVWPAEKMAWIDDATLPGVKSVTLWGDPTADQEPHAVRCATDQECKFVLGAPGRFSIDFVRMG